MKKIIAVIIFVAVIAIIIFAFKSCDVAKKTDTETETPATEETVNLSAYRDAFVSANTEFTCQILNDPTLTENQDTMKQLLDDAYSKYGFPVENDTLMIDILNLYETDQEVIEEIKAKVNECKI